MRTLIACAALLLGPVDTAEAAPSGRGPAGVVMGPGYVAPGLRVRVHRGGGRHSPAAGPSRIVEQPDRQVVVVLKPVRPPKHPGFRFGYAPRDWTAREFGQADWSGDAFAGEDFRFGPW